MLLFISVILGLVVGIVLTLAVQWYFLYQYFFANASENANNVTSQKPDTGKRPFQLPQEILNLLDVHDSTKKESCVALNLIFQFLFKELRDTVRVRRWFMKKLSGEFEELLQRSTTGKLLEQITVRDLHLGHQFPVIKSVSVKNVRLQDAGHIEELDIVVDLDYNGGFQLAVDADMVLGRSAFLAVRVTRVQGIARLQFTRHPYTHWSFAFCDEPLMDFQVESHFQGRSLSQVTSLIINQIRRSVRKKHTLPNYKIRHKPFFEKPDTSGGPENVYLLGNKLTQGLMEVTVVECSRLFRGAIGNDSLVYCTLAVDSTAWVELAYSWNTSWVTRDLDLDRQQGQFVGITFKQEFILDKYEQCVVVETVVPNSPAALADIKRGDILVAVGGKKVATAGQATKLFKQSGEKLTVRIERRSALKRSLSQESLFRDDDSIGSCQGLGASPAAAAYDDDSSESPDSGTSKSSPTMKSPLSHSPAKKQPQRERNVPQSHLLRRVKGTTVCLSDSGKRSDNPGFDLPRTVEVDGPNGGIILNRTSAVKFIQDPLFNETFSLDVGERHKFLNLSIWCRNLDQKTEKLDRAGRPDKDLLLGHVSILLVDIAMECASTSQSFHQRTFQFLPPEPKAVAYSSSRSNKFASHPGFDESLCYGDVTLSFVYKPQAIGKRTKASSVRDSVSEVDAGEDGFSMLNDSIGDKDGQSEHDFIITQFHSTISCHFCGKKIWLKMAFQCRSCALVCHKKCVVKCQAATTCCRDGVQLKQSEMSRHSTAASNVVVAPYPEIITTDAGINNVLDCDGSVEQLTKEEAASLLESPRTQRRLRSLLSTLVNTSHSHEDSQPPPSSISGLIRAGSVHNLAPPPQQCLPTQSKSLPPSPQTSPAVSRKTSLQGSLFQTGRDSEPEDDMETTVERLLQYSSDEMVVTVAKEKGRELFANYSLDERREKLHILVSKLQTEIDQETENRNVLARSERQTVDLGRKAKFAILIAKSDEKIQALAILMLYYCSGLQHCQELEELLKEQAARIVHADLSVAQIGASTDG